MRTWICSALILSLPAALPAQDLRRAAAPRSAARNVSVRHIAAPAQQAQAAAAAPDAAPAGVSTPRDIDAPQAFGAAQVSAGMPGAGGLRGFQGRSGHGWSGRFHRALSGPRKVGTRTQRSDDPQPQQPAPYADKPGALIRTEGLGYTTQPAAAPRENVVDAGKEITIDLGKSILLNPHPGIHQGAADKTTKSAASGRNAITPNSTDDSKATNSGD